MYIVISKNKREGELNKLDEKEERTIADDFLDFILIADAVAGDDEDEEDEGEDTNEDE